MCQRLERAAVVRLVTSAVQVYGSWCGAEFTKPVLLLLRRFLVVHIYGCHYFGIVFYEALTTYIRFLYTLN